MMIKLVRIGRDAELKTTPTGTELLEMSVVYDVGFGDNKKPQWVKLAMFGQRAPKLVGHFTKGKQIVVTMDDVKSEAWIKDGEAKSAISAKLIEFDFVAGQQDGQTQGSQQQAPRQAPVPQHDATSNQHRQPQHNTNVNEPPMDFDDSDIPF
ncbi:MAG TPA: single-stranded DNA-binding protein [Psychromonas sp.]